MDRVQGTGWTLDRRLEDGRQGAGGGEARTGGARDASKEVGLAGERWVRAVDHDIAWAERRRRCVRRRVPHAGPPTAGTKIPA